MNEPSNGEAAPGSPPAGGFGVRGPGAGDSPAFGPVIPPSPHQPSKAYAVATLGVGIASIVGVVVCFASLPLGLGAIAMGVYGIRRCDRHPDLFAGRGYAIAGMICGGFAVSLAIAAVFYFMRDSRAM